MDPATAPADARTRNQPAPSAPSPWNQPVTSLRGVGPALAEQLARLNIFRTMDLLLHLPARYQDRTRAIPVADMQPGQECLAQGEVVDSRILVGRRRTWAVTLMENRGAQAETQGFAAKGGLRLRFFHFGQKQVDAMRPGSFVRCFGEVRVGAAGLEMVHPEYRIHSEMPTEFEQGLTPVYPTTKGLSQKRLRGLIAQLANLEWPAEDALSLPTLLFLHRPDAKASEQAIGQAQDALARQELTAYYLMMRFRQSHWAQHEALPLPRVQQLGRDLLNHLGFRLTGAQRRVVREVLLDLERREPMLRLLQGDVGSGKTVVAAFAAARGAEHGAQTAIMAPTEVLAEQHYQSFSSWLAPLGVSVALLTGGQRPAQRRRLLEGLASGEILVALGTHALFQRDVTFHNLALAVIDEQHRFGVHQRMALRAKGRTPHQLIMTATPIPRTLTMALYADMDVSVLDELPPGRQPVTTRLVAAGRRDELLGRLAKVLDSGQQAYWICTLIEDSEQLDAQAAESTWEMLRDALPGRRIGLIHGRMKSERKAAEMASFKSGETALLVATTVIEVGVDVPNASLMIIENPERLGLAQLHQLRGRIGRGARASHCLLLYGENLKEASRARLRVIRNSQDGFYIAEQDLALRGPGEILGSRQTGESRFRVASLTRHGHLLPEIVQEGDRLLREAPNSAEVLRQIWAGGDANLVSV